MHIYQLKAPRSNDNKLSPNSNKHTYLVFLILFFNRRNQSFLEKRLLLGLGEEIYRVILEHPVVPENNKVCKKSLNNEVCQMDTGAN